MADAPVTAEDLLHAVDNADWQRKVHILAACLEQLLLEECAAITAAHPTPSEHRLALLLDRDRNNLVRLWDMAKPCSATVRRVITSLSPARVARLAELVETVKHSAPDVPELLAFGNLLCAMFGHCGKATGWEVFCVQYHRDLLGETPDNPRYGDAPRMASVLERVGTTREALFESIQDIGFDLERSRRLRSWYLRVKCLHQTLGGSHPLVRRLDAAVARAGNLRRPIQPNATEPARRAIWKLVKSRAADCSSAVMVARLFQADPELERELEPVLAEARDEMSVTYTARMFLDFRYALKLWHDGTSPERLHIATVLERLTLLRQLLAACPILIPLVRELVSEVDDHVGTLALEEHPDFSEVWGELMSTLTAQYPVRE